MLQRFVDAAEIARVRSLCCLASTPFPGLQPFREDEAHLLFGRENQVDAMVDKLADTRFLAVVGTSGSGKSSPVNCGDQPPTPLQYYARLNLDIFRARMFCWAGGN
jgi:hypothetical protein